MRYYETSAKENKHLDFPFLTITRSFLKEPNLQSYTPCFDPPPDYKFDPELVKQYENELKDTPENQLLSDDDFLD